jgi:hypothetical protein
VSRELGLFNADGIFKAEPMPETDLSAVVILLASCAALLLMLLLLMFGILSKLSRLERLFRQQPSRQEVAEVGPSAAERSSEGAFEKFLNEDPSRRELSKAEQFSAYRIWRQEKGMNWSNS